MALEYPKYPGDVSDGDEHSYSPKKTKDSLLATERGTDYTRRIETDANRNLFVNVAASDAEISILTKGTVSGLADGLSTTVVNYVANLSTKIAKISCSGDGPADFSLVINTVQQDIKRSDTLDLDKEFTFSPMLGFNQNDVIEVKVLHHATGKLKSFNVTIYGV